MSDRDLRTRRERAVDALCDQFARDELSLEEFERRVDRAHRAETLEELNELLQDLPGARGALERAAEGARKAGAPEARRTDVPADRVRDHAVVLAVLGGNTRRGRWIPARRTFSLAVCGGVSLDFREASLGPGTTEVHVMAVCGGVEIVVPPGLSVESEGFAVMGGFENADAHPTGRDPDEPVLRVRGVAVCGSVEVSVRRPGESSREARRRIRERRRRRGRVGDGDR